MQVLRKQSFTILCYVIAENHTQRIIGVSSSPKRRLPATLSSIVMRPPQDVAALAQGGQKRGGARGYSALGRRD